MSNYKELLDTIEPASSDEAFANRIIRKAEEKQTYSRGSGFKSLYVLTAMILIFGIGAITAGIVWNSDFFKPPEAPPVIIPGLWDNAHAKYTSEVSVLYADKDSYFMSVSIKSTTGKPLPRGYTGRYQVEIYPEIAVSGFGYTEVNYINDYEIQVNFHMFETLIPVSSEDSIRSFKRGSLEKGTEYTITLKESGLHTAVNFTTVLGPNDFTITFVYEGAESHTEDVIVVYPKAMGSSDFVNNVTISSAFGTIIRSGYSSEYDGNLGIIYRMSDGRYVERVLTTTQWSIWHGLEFIANDYLVAEEIDIYDIEAIIFMGEEIPIK